MLRERISYNLAQELYRAAALCSKSSEEEGGLLLHRDEDFEFVKLRNIYTGSTTALGLYEAHEGDFGELIVPRVQEGWKLHGSFHTHPSFSPSPSSLDLNKLFMGFKYNYIYATERGYYSASEWMGEAYEDLYIYYLPKSSMEALLSNGH